ncbi:phage tail assembly protein [Kribbella italica]|uniref:Tail assembly chaperone n=1 Tax=Kribbella italica TaxID=1540520 RepID=A0A7W9J0I6_9ACTN|nr:phage tail assembly protein [Kribbella italica]MBB5833411.1 hypothetical protein [Kribbella italica]
MSNSFTLDDIRDAAEAKYGSTEIVLGDGSVCRLLNPLRLKKEKRDQLMALQKEQGDEESDTEELLAKSLLLVAENQKYAKQLLKELDGDLTMLATVFEMFNSGAQVGEASPSQD